MRPEERRYEYRIPAEIIIDQLDHCDLKPGKFQASIRELSASGCRLQSSLELKIGQEFDISFNLEGGLRIECARVRVVRRLSHRTHKVVAMEFMDLPEEDQYRIREFIIWKEAQEAE